MKRPFASLFAGWFQPIYGVAYVEDVPVAVTPFTVYLIGLKNEPWQAAFICPCGCGDLIQLNLLREGDPRWKVYVKKRKPTIYPSVWRTSGCRSHFHLRKGKIVWARQEW